MHYELGKLTRYPAGSIRELFKVASPLMITYLSGYLMLFLDRLILARFSTEAMNTVATVGLVCYIFDYALIGITSVVEVLVGKLNGEGSYQLLGKPVWQAIWLCIFSFALCIPLAMFGGKYLVPQIYQELGSKYYVVSVLTCPFFGLGAAFSAFFIGQGKGHIVTIVVLLSNVLNLVLSIILVFGFWGLPRLGPYGAAIATAIAEFLQVIFLWVIFLQRSNRRSYGTGEWQFKLKLFKEVITLGMPNSLSHILEIAAWALVARMLATVSNEQVTLFSIGQSLFILFAAFSEGLQKGVMAISANFIGAKSYNLILKNLTSANYLHIIFCGCLLLLLIFKPDLIGKLFFAHTELELGQITQNCLWVLLYFALDGLVWIRTAILMSLQDLTFIMLSNVIIVGLFAVLPIYIFIVKNPGSELTSWQLAWISAVISLAVYSYRAKAKLQELLKSPIK